MASASKTKYENARKRFILEPILEKPVSAIAGIGQVYEERLKAVGCEKAYSLLGYFLVLNKDKTSFVEWLQQTCGATKHNATEAYQCLADWCNVFM